MKRKKQRMPVPHPLMNRSYNPEVASTFFKVPFRDRIGRHLPIELMRSNRPKFDEALNRISIAAWRYTESRKGTFPTVKKHRDNLTNIRERTNELRKLLKEPDTETYRRVYQQLGQKYPDENYKSDDDGHFEPITEEIDEYNDGKRQYEAIESLLERLAGAAEKIINRLPNPRGRPETVAPPLETSFAHAVADIWCGVTGEPFAGAVDAVGKHRNIRSNQEGVKFLELIVGKVIPDITKERLSRLIKKVATQRYEEAEKPRPGRRDKSGRGGHHY